MFSDFYYLSTTPPGYPGGAFLESTLSKEGEKRIMESGDVIQLFTYIETINETLENLMIVNFLLAGLITGVLLIFIFFFFLKGAE